MSRDVPCTCNDFFQGKVVLITGSSNGIGRQAAVRFAALGAKITITGTKADTLKVTKQLCIEAGANESDIVEVLGDIATESTAQALINGTINKFGQLDVLVNNAGLGIADKQDRRGIEQPVEIYDRTMAVNMRAVIVLSQLAIPYLEKTKGAIINISSIASQPKTFETFPYYSISKAALDQLTIQMAGTLIKKGIRVNSINPGMIVTNILNNAGLSKEQMESHYQKYGATIPIGRAAEPNEIAELILFLADRSKSEFIVGQRFISDGGTSIQSE